MAHRPVEIHEWGRSAPLIFVSIGRSGPATTAATNIHLRGLFAHALGLLMVLAALGNWELGSLRDACVLIACGLALGSTCMLIARY